MIPKSMSSTLIGDVQRFSDKIIRKAQPTGESIMDRRKFLAGSAALATALARPALAQGTEVSFFYPIAVGGPITKIIDGYAADFEKANPSIKVKPIYSGTYQESITKALTAHKSGTPPVTSVLLSTDMFTLIDEDAIVPVDGFLKTDEDKKWLASFFPGFMLNSQTPGKESKITWGVPFQRSTIVLYWNKELFREAGLDPEKAPATWAEELAFAEKLTKRDASGNTTQWGMQIPSSGFPYWLFQGLTTPNDVVLMNPEGDRTFYDKPAVIEALARWADLGRKHKVMAPGVIEWGTTPKDFFERKCAMMWTTTGNLTNVRTNAKFPFGVAMLPANKRRGSPTGGGNFYIFRKANREQQAAAVKFAQWMTSPERAAQWGIDTGYVAVRGDAWETPAMKKYVEGFPAAAVARDQLQYSVAELSTHDNQRVTKALNDGLQAALNGTKTPEQAMKDAQAEAERLLKPYRT
jgi:sn-glycerol 3-phosphate transport system substrate-binding protein